LEGLHYDFIVSIEVRGWQSLPMQAARKRKEIVETDDAATGWRARPNGETRNPYSFSCAFQIFNSPAR